MMKSAFNAYQKYAWGHESLSPIAKKATPVRYGQGGRNSGESILASLSTLWVMNLTEEYNVAREWVEKSFNFTQIDNKVYTHDLVGKYFGALLSAYALTGDELFLKKSVEVYSVLNTAYNENGLYN